MGAAGKRCDEPLLRMSAARLARNDSKMIFEIGRLDVTAGERHEVQIDD